VISRQWRGLIKIGNADAYVKHLRNETFPALQKLSGFKGASILHRELPEGIEFLIITQWDSLESIRAFAGSNVETAVVPQKAQHMMVEFDPIVRHYEVLE
jgi:heme-degrading monooxygenase HmoA